MMRKTEAGTVPHFVVFGGLLGGDMGVTNELHSLDLTQTATQRGSWAVIAAKGSAPCPRRAHSAVVVPAEVAALQGPNKGVFELTAALAGRSGVKDMQVDGELMFVFGGLTPTGTANGHVELMQATNGLAAAAAASRSSMRDVHSATTILGDLCVYDGMQNSWRQLSHQTTGSPPEARFGHSMSFVPGRDRRRAPHILICGGATWTGESAFSVDSAASGRLHLPPQAGASNTQALDSVAAAGWRRQALGDVHMLDLHTLAWSRVELGFIPFSPRMNHSCVVHTAVAAHPNSGPAAATATAPVSSLLPRDMDPAHRTPAARVQILVFGGMSSTLCDASVWRGRLRRRRGQFFSFTDVVSKATYAARSAAEKAAERTQPAGQRIMLPPTSALPADPDATAAVDAVYESDGDADSDGIGAAEAERLVSRAREYTAVHSNSDTAHSPGLLTTRFVVADSDDEDAAVSAGVSAAGHLRQNPASPIRLKSPTKPGHLPYVQAVGSTNVFADIVATAGQKMADAVQQRLMALQKRVIELHGTLDREMAARKRLQQLSDDLASKLDSSNQELVRTVSAHEHQLFSVRQDASQRVAAAEGAAEQAASDLKRVTSAAYLLQTAAEHRIEHLERVVAGLLQGSSAAPGEQREAQVDTEETREQAEMYSSILQEMQLVQRAPAESATGHAFPAEGRGNAVAADPHAPQDGCSTVKPQSPPPLPSVAPLHRSERRTPKPRLLAPAADA